MTTIGTNGTNNGNNNDNDESSWRTLTFKFIPTKGHVHAHILTIANVNVKCIHLCIDNPKRDRQKPTLHTKQKSELSFDMKNKQIDQDLTITNLSE